MARNSEDTVTANPLDRLKSEATDLIGAFGDRAVSSLRDRVEDATGRLADYAEGAATPGIKAAVSGASRLAEGKSPVRALASASATSVKEKVSKMFGKGGDSGKGPKVTNIVESVDVGVPVRLVYDQWTRFTDFPTFMKKVESVEQAEDQKLNWKAQVLWSHRTWEATILEQSPDEKIVWRAKGPKGYADGAVTFHELAPNLTRVLVTLEYHPQGFFEHTGNIWRAQGRRVRLELKHFRRYVMTEALLHPDDVDGWRGVISDGEVQGHGTSGRGRARRGRGDSAETGQRKSAGNGRSSQQSRSGSGNGRRAASRQGEAGGDGTRPASGRGSARSASSSSRSGGSGSSATRSRRTQSSTGGGSGQRARQSAERSSR